MKRFLTLAFLVAIFAGTVNAATAGNNKKIVGEWKYEASAAPYGYEKGVLIIAEKDGKLTGQVKFEDGYKIDLKNVTFTDGVFKCGLYVDYEYINVKAKVEGKKMKGAVSTPDGELPINASKVK